MIIPDHIFRTYDIRGVYPDEINEESAYHIGRAFGTLVRGKGWFDCVVGRDNRTSSEPLSKAVIRGLTDSGCNVIYTGLTTNPQIHFFTRHESFHGGVNITASHNPLQFNGIKLDLNGAVPVWGIGLKELREVCLKENYVSGEGAVQEKDLSESYVKYVTSKFTSLKSGKIVVDSGTGAAGVSAKKIFEKLGLNTVFLHCEPDSSFPLGPPDPEGEVMQKRLSSEVLEHGADIGFALDTDGDRLNVVDEKGKSYRSDEILMLISEDMLKRYPGGQVVYDVKCTGLLDNVIKKAGGIPKMTATGRSIILNEMNKSLLGGEFSGHIYIGGDDYLGYDDGIFTALTVLKIIQEHNLPLSALMSSYPRLPSTLEIKVDVSDKEKPGVMETVRRLVSDMVKNEDRIIRVLYIDGVRAYISETGWFLIRSSNTSPYLSVRAEGKDQEELDALLSITEEILKKALNN